MPITNYMPIFGSRRKREREEKNSSCLRTLQVIIVRPYGLDFQYGLRAQQTRACYVTARQYTRLFLLVDEVKDSRAVLYFWKVIVSHFLSTFSLIVIRRRGPASSAIREQG